VALGDASPVLDELAPDLGIVNLESSITSSDAQPAKAVLYRMHPGNVGRLTAARLDACTLANNHVMDSEHSGADAFCERVRRVKQPGDIAVVSVHGDRTGDTTCRVRRSAFRVCMATQSRCYHWGGHRGGDLVGEGGPRPRDHDAHS
jgi:poly-gamma-glutamate capsule biosynthesis protein CapA/YwtB (metallophosphatase superfamily)